MNPSPLSLLLLPASASAVGLQSTPVDGGFPFWLIGLAVSALIWLFIARRVTRWLGQMGEDAVIDVGDPGGTDV